MLGSWVRVPPSLYYINMYDYIYILYLILIIRIIKWTLVDRSLIFIIFYRNNNFIKVEEIEY